MAGVGGTSIQFEFFGAGDQNKKALGRLHLVTRYPSASQSENPPTHYFAAHMASFDLYLSNKAGIEDGPITANQKAVDRIDVTADALPTPPLIKTTALIAAVFTPSPGYEDARLVVGRYNGTGATDPSWAVMHIEASGTGFVLYLSKPPSATAEVHTATLDSADTTVFVVFRRDGENLETWVNGRYLGVAPTFATSMNDGVGPVSIGARQTATSPVEWGDAFDGAIQEVALSNGAIDDLKISLVMHQMAERTIRAMGTPIELSIGQGVCDVMDFLCFQNVFMQCVS